MSRGVQVVVVCEDLQHEVFIRAFLLARGFHPRSLRFKISPSGSGDAKKFVCAQFPVELKAIRSYGGENRVLLIMTDADNLSVNKRKKTVIDSCVRAKVKKPIATDPVFFFIPKWEIETWQIYLAGDSTDENEKNNKKLDQESEAYPLAEKLAKMCAANALTPTPPSSLEVACAEYGRLKEFIES